MDAASADALKHAAAAILPTLLLLGFLKAVGTWWDRNHR